MRDLENIQHHFYEHELKLDTFLLKMMLYLVWKILRKDYMYWFRVDGFMGVIGSFINRVVAKVIADFSGCLHLR